MIQGLSIAGDVFWIVALALMASVSLATWKLLPPDARLPVLWRDMTATLSAPKAVGLLAIPVAAFAVGAWLKIESRAEHLETTSALIVLGIRVTIAPLLALLHITRTHRAMQVYAAGSEPPR